MRLGEWMDKNNVSRYSMASKLGVTYSMVTQVLSGRRWFGTRRVKKIMEITGGQVTPNDLFGKSKGKGKAA